MDLNVQFANPPQREFYFATARNQCLSGGFNNGKTFIGCFKITTLLLQLPNYRVIIARERYTDLKRTTMQTFFKNFPSELVKSHNENDGYTQLVNASAIYWMHLDSADENSMRGIEPNSILVDQAEETTEKLYDVLDSRLGRWDGVVIPENYIKMHEEETGTPWPMSAMGRPLAPSYLMLLTNPDDTFHYIYRKYHPESPERNSNYFYVNAEWDPNLGSRESYDEAMKRDPEWVDKYVLGKWGQSRAQIHNVRNESLLEPTEQLLERIKSKGNLFRILDHGDAAPTCCLWVAAMDGCYIFFREYYVPGKVISYHRQAITDLSEGEEYSGNYADPSIFKKTAQKDGGFWSVADEYKTDTFGNPPLYWQPADNNEFATRNRINELLQVQPHFINPITKSRPAVGIYFIKATRDYPYGCKEAIKQTGSQRRENIGTIDGKTVFTDDRDKNITDHAYDCVRYFVAMHGPQPSKVRKKPMRNSFAYFNELLRRKQIREDGLLAGSNV